MCSAMKSEKSPTSHLATSTTEPREYLPHWTADILVIRDAMILSWVKDDPDLFQKRVLQRKTIKQECWEWTGAERGKGYPSVNIPRKYGVRKSGKNIAFPAHRATFLWKYGPIEYGLVVDHDDETIGCGNKLCINPEHLVITYSGINTGRKNLLKEECPRCGGDYSVKPTGYRYCDPCRKIALEKNRIRTQEALRQAGKALGVGQIEYKRLFKESYPIAMQILEAVEQGRSYLEIVESLGRTDPKPKAPKKIRPKIINSVCPRCNGPYTESPWKPGKRMCMPCFREGGKRGNAMRNALRKQAREALGLSNKKYLAQFGSSSPIAKKVIEMIDAGATPEEVIEALGRTNL